MTNENRSFEDAQSEENEHRFPDDAPGAQPSSTEATTAAVLREKLNDTMTPGFLAEFDAVEAEQVGAFTEDALSEVDALDSTIDLDVQEGQ
jgi:hypothetical protein